jgi:hypothetical protein
MIQIKNKKTRNQYKRKKQKTMKQTKRINLKTRKNRISIVAKGLTVKWLPNNTPKEIDAISQKIKDILSVSASAKKSYSPSINRDLVTIKSISRDDLLECNSQKAFNLKEPIKINVGNKCYPYSDPVAKAFLLKNLSANKHVNSDKIITPKQSLSNCWFNTMFVSLFVSNKGRKFFHFFRSLMIEGHNAKKEPIPQSLKNGFALLNYAIEACLTGNEYAYNMDTNAIIESVYKAIPKEYKDTLPYMTPTKQAGNPIRYYGSIMYYLNDQTIDMYFLSSANNNWNKMLNEKLKINENKTNKYPHIIVLEFFDAESKTTTNKPTKFQLGNAKYQLDSGVIRDKNGNHFSSLLTCEKKEMAYDGMSFHRLVNMEWKKRINDNYSWRFEGSNDAEDRPIEWNFLSAYQMLIYYRI